MSLENDFHPAHHPTPKIPTTFPYIKLLHDRIVTYAHTEDRIVNRKISENSLKNLEDNHVKGNLSANSLRRIRKKLLPWFYAVEYKANEEIQRGFKPRRQLVMITLTLSADTIKNDYDLKRELFGRFIEYLRLRKGVKHYFIRYENQENGRLHGHLIIDNYIDKKDLQEQWNSHQNRLGLIDKFEKKHGHRNPPSTHIKAIGTDTGTIDYLLKYATKEEKYKPVQGHLYGMSDTLRNLSLNPEIIDSGINAFLKEFNDNENYVTYEGEYFRITYISKQDYFKKLPDYIQKSQTNYYLDTYNYLYLSGKHPLHLNTRYSQLQQSQERLRERHVSGSPSGSPSGGLPEQLSIFDEHIGLSFDHLR